MAEIKVTITDETGNSNSVALPTGVKPNNPTPNDVIKTNEVKTKESATTKQNSKALALASMVGSRALGYTTSNVGKWTGNSRNQQLVSNIQQGAGLAAMAYVNPYIALATIGLTMATTAIDASYDNFTQRGRSQMKLAKAGYNDVGDIVGRRH